MDILFETERLFICELTKEEKTKFEERKIGDFENNEYAIHLKSNNEIIGIIGYMCEEEKNAELRYGIKDVHQGNGYMTETVKGMITYLFEKGKEKITIICKVDNIPSNKVAIKAGFELIKTAEYKHFGLCNYYTIKR